MLPYKQIKSPIKKFKEAEDELLKAFHTWLMDNQQ